MTWTAQRLLADIRELAPHVTSRAAEVEAGRRIPIDLVEVLGSPCGCSTVAPTRHGGLELEGPTALDVVATLGRLGGWLCEGAMNGARSHFLVHSLPRETYDQVYQN